MIASPCGCLLRPDEPLAVQFASTRYFNGHGLVDLFDEPATLTHWFKEHIADPAGLVAPVASVGGRDFGRVREARTAVIALLRAATEDLTPPEGALALVNQALRQLREPQLAWPSDGPSSVGWRTPRSVVDIGLGRVYLSTVETVTEPRRSRLRACPAPRCVLFFTMSHPRQQWCSNVCGNRARVARFGERHTG